MNETERLNSLTDTKAQRAARIRKRRAALNAIAVAAGYDSWDKLATAALNGEHIIINYPQA